MKLSISNIAWQPEHNEEVYLLMQEYNFSGLEIVPSKFNIAASNNLAIAEQHNLKIVSMQSLLFGMVGYDLYLFGEATARQNLFAHLQQNIIYAESINCPALIFGNPKNRIMQNIASDYNIAVEFFKKLGDFADQHNTCLCIEPTSVQYGTNFVTNLESANQLVNDVASKGFKMIIDTGNMLLDQDDLSLIPSVIVNTKHVHISMPFLKPLNLEYQKHKDWLNRFVKTLKTLEYDKYLSIEMLNPSIIDISQSLAVLNQLAR